ncbi:rab GTPase-activating protein 1-like [Oryzias melastigma]|uniref:RAB GTPase activating protein 1-like 2 n=1 Tax=Oryzias melastigma TaxID=30732 RepID=A0A3B3DFD8_ORYME|nr:rab GTPase-activating protein 1-like [Oryzias melastigma]
MMEEMSMVTACDARAIEEMSEEEILACLVAETEPTFTVPSKKAKLKESRLQFMDKEPLDTYVEENRRLQQTSLRLEQENDNLAHTLITSKVLLRNALDQAEDRVDELTKDLLQARHQLKITEEEKRGKEEEAAMMKEVLRRELEKAEQEIKRSSGIIADYKQICSQLTLRLEEQQAAHTDKLNTLKSAIKDCPRCRHTAGSLLESYDSKAEQQTGVTEEAKEEPDPAFTAVDQRRQEDQEKESLRAQIRNVEKELAQTKLQMVEANCRIQELEHQKGVLSNNLQEAKNSWINKAFMSLRTSGSGLPSISLHRDGPPALSLHSSSLSGLSGWTPKKLSWPHRDNRAHV